MKHVEYISYTGKYPNLCSGILTLKIDGKILKFGDNYLDSKPILPPFWMSGGICGFTDNYGSAYVHEGRWIIDPRDLPVQYQKYADEIIKVFNDNVPYGCCGGCL